MQENRRGSAITGAKRKKVEESALLLFLSLLSRENYGTFGLRKKEREREEQS